MFSHQRINLRVFIKFQCIACIKRLCEYNGFMFSQHDSSKHEYCIVFKYILVVLFLRPKLSKLNTRKTILTMYVTSSKFAPMQLKGIPTSMQNDVIFCKAVFKPILKAALLFADQEVCKKGFSYMHDSTTRFKLRNKTHTLV